MQSSHPTPLRSSRRSARSPPIIALPTTTSQSLSLPHLVDLSSTTPSLSLSPNKKHLPAQSSSFSNLIFNPSTTKSTLSPPPLPLQKFNPLLSNFSGRLRSVRTQQIAISDSHSITIARIKIPAPPGASAHLIKRFDTDAVSATSFFKTAFPLASEEEEERQMVYLASIYDTARAGALHLGPDHKLTGLWVPTEHASALAKAYGLTQFAAPLIQHSLFPHSALPTKPERTPKRARAGPPSFGATSPSTFSLSLPVAPQQPIEIEADLAEEPPTVSADDEAERPKSTTSKLMGSDADVARAKQEAIELVEGIRESLPPPPPPQQQPQQQTSTPTTTGELTTTDAPPPKKRLLEQEEEPVHDGCSSEIEDDQQLAPGSSSSSMMSKPRSFISRLIWKNKIQKSNWSTKIQNRAMIGLPKSSTIGYLMDSTNPGPGGEENLSKRNLAVAGIVIAGAAASIAPYFF